MTTPASNKNLKRPIEPMPDDIAQLLRELGLEAAYAVRPPYQRNDYLSWISRAKRMETRAKRINQMLDELETGTAYMKMPYNGPTGSTEQD